MIIDSSYSNVQKPVIRSGSLLIEMTVALGLLSAIGVVLLIGSIDLLAPRNWIIVQNMADSYLTHEEAYAKRISFDEFTDDDNDIWTAINPNWEEFDPDAPVSPTSVFDLPVETGIGKLPGGRVIPGTITRIRIKDPTNIPSPSALPDYKKSLTDNPAKMETWRLQSILTYTIGGKKYYKSRTVVRTR